MKKTFLASSIILVVLFSYRFFFEDSKKIITPKYYPVKTTIIAPKKIDDVQRKSEKPILINRPWNSEACQEYIAESKSNKDLLEKLRSHKFLSEHEEVKRLDFIHNGEPLRVSWHTEAGPDGREVKKLIAYRLDEEDYPIPTKEIAGVTNLSFSEIKEKFKNSINYSQKENILFLSEIGAVSYKVTNGEIETISAKFLDCDASGCSCL